MKKWNIEPPRCQETEKAILGAILLNNDCISGLGLLPSHFYFSENRTVYEAMQRLAEKESPIDAVTLAGALGKDGVKKVGGALYISELTDSCASSESAEHYAKQLKNQAKVREMIKLCMDIATDGSKSDVDIQTYLAASRNSIIGLIDDTEDLCNSVTATESVVSAYEQAISSERPEGLVSTGIGQLDNKFGGLWPGLTTVLASRPSMGKSCLALNVAANACLKGKRVLLISMEDTRTFCNWRMLARFANVSIDKILKRELTDRDKFELQVARDTIKCFDMRIIDRGGMTSQKIKSACISHANKYGVDLVIIDHLGHINEPGRSLYESTSLAARTIATIAPELNVPVVLLHQLNRAVEDRDKPLPRLSDLRQSGEVEQLARVVWLLYRPYYYSKNENEKNDMSLIVAKNSHGPTDVLQLCCDMPKMYITDGTGGY